MTFQIKPVIALYLCWWIISFCLTVSACASTNGSQSDALCGAKCLYVILSAVGRSPESNRKLVDELGPAPRNGYSLLQLRDCARKHDLYAECVHLSKDELARLCKTMGVILHLSKFGDSNIGHYVICEEVSFPRVTIFDASKGQASQVSDEILTTWTGNTLLVSNVPIELSQEFSLGRRSIKPYLLVGVLVLAAVLGIVLRTGKFRLVGLGFLASFLSAAPGCRNERRVELDQTNASLTLQEDASATLLLSALPPSKSGLWVDEPMRNVGTILRQSTPFLVPVKIFNTDTEKVIIKHADFTCGCLFGSFSSLTLFPNSTITCDLMLDCSKIGPKSASVKILTDRNEQVSISVNWNVTASLTSEPEVINGMQLKCGESASASINLQRLSEYDENLLQAECKTFTRGAADFFEVSAVLKGKECVATFSATSDAPTGLVKGHIQVGIPGDETVQLKIPFTVYVERDIDLTPTKLFLNERGGLLRGQLMLSAKNLAGLDPVELVWIGTTRIKCKFDFNDASDVRIIDVITWQDEVNGVELLEISAGGGTFIRQIPVYFP